MADTRVEQKLDRVQQDVNEIKVILARNTTSLEEHMRRTAIAEERIELVQTQVNDKLEPVRKHVVMVNTTLKVLAAAGAVVLFLKQLGILDKLF